MLCAPAQTHPSGSAGTTEAAPSPRLCLQPTTPPHLDDALAALTPVLPLQVLSMSRSAAVATLALLALLAGSAQATYDYKWLGYLPVVSAVLSCYCSPCWRCFGDDDSTEAERLPDYYSASPNGALPSHPMPLILWPSPSCRPSLMMLLSPKRAPSLLTLSPAPVLSLPACITSL